MTALIAALIISATTPMFHVELSEPADVVSATMAYQEITGATHEITLQPLILAGPFPQGATCPGVVDVYLNGEIVTIKRGWAHGWDNPCEWPSPAPQQQWRSWPFTYWGRGNWRNHLDRWSPDWRLIHVATVGNKVWTLWEAK